MLTLGIDLASAPKRTGVCLIEWSDGAARVLDAHLGATDDDLLTAIEGADKVGVDVPFGWPDEFVKAVLAYHESGTWPDVPKHLLRYRATDRHVHKLTGKWPLSVSSDRIAVPAMRMARLFTELERRGERVPRDGSGKLVEVYPAATLMVWGLKSTGYKRANGGEVRRKVVAELLARMPWLEVSDEARTECERSDDVLDALVAGLTARAARGDASEAAPETEQLRANREGWIAIPADYPAP